MRLKDSAAALPHHAVCDKLYMQIESNVTA